MDRPRIGRGAAIAAAVVFAVAARAATAPDIGTAGATLDTGPAPGRGVLLVDPRAAPAVAPPLPAVPMPDAIDPMTGPVPKFSDTGSGSAGAYHATADVSLPGGTYDYRTYTVDAGVTVTYTGAATIRCTGDVLLQGRIVTTSDDAPIVLRGGGDVHLTSDGTAPGTGVTTSGARSGVAIEAALRFVADITDSFAGPEVRAADGDVLVRCGSNLLAGPFTLIVATRGSAVVQAWGGDVRAEECAEFRSSRGETRIEASGSATFTDGAILAAQSGALAVRAIGGTLILERGTTAATDGGALLLEAGGDVVLRSFVEVSLSGAGALSVVSHERDVHLGERAPDADVDTGLDDCDLLQPGSGPITVDARRSVVIHGMSSAAAARGDVAVTAGTDVRFLSGGRVTSDRARVIIRAGNAVETRAMPDVEDPPPPYVQAAAVSVQSGEGGVDLPTVSVAADAGPCTIVSSGAIRLGGTLYASGDVLLRSAADGIDLTRSEIGTYGSVPVSGSVLVETYGASIDAEDATILSGDATVTSGDVRVLVHTGRPPLPAYVPPLRPAPGTVDDEGAMLVTSATVTRPRSGPPRVRVLGFAEGGFHGVPLSHPGTFEVGGRVVQATRSAAPGRRLRIESEGFRLDVLAPRRRDGRTPFRLTATGGVPGTLDEHLDGRLDVHFHDAVITGHAAVLLDRGRFDLATRRGRLVMPRIFVVGTHAVRHADGSADLRIEACIANDADALPLAPEGVSVSVGTAFSAILNGTGARRTGPGRFTSRHPADGVDRVQLDYVRGLLRIALTGVDIPGPALASTVDLELGLTHGGDRRDAVVRLARHGTSLVYEGRR